MNLLQALYDPGSPFPEDEEFYQLALKDIEFFAVSSQVYDLLKQRGQLSHTPEFFQVRLKQKVEEALYPNILIKNQTDKILHTFEDAGIPAIPLKGTWFAEKYFGQIGARWTSDIDLLIQTTDLEQAIAGVKSLGYTMEEERIPAHFHWSFSKELPGSPIPLTVELHWDILKGNTSNFQIEEFWKEAKPLQHYRYIKELSDYHTFYMICLHGWRHNLNSLKYFIDIIQMIHVLHDKIDYTVLFRDAAAHKTLKRMIRTLSIVYNQFPHLEKIRRLPLQRKRLWWEYQAIRNADYRTVRTYVDFVDYQFFGFDTIKHSLASICECLQAAWHRQKEPMS